ncbi:MAG: hypothetical protein Kow0040_09860 [Thermogutta sp.]
MIRTESKFGQGSIRIAAFWMHPFTPTRGLPKDNGVNRHIRKPTVSNGKHRRTLIRPNVAQTIVPCMR